MRAGTSVERPLEKTFEKTEVQTFGRGSNQSGLRAHNERLVLTLLRSLGPTAKAEIARISGLSAQTVSVITRDLEKDGLPRAFDAHPDAPTYLHVRGDPKSPDKSKDSKASC